MLLFKRNNRPTSCFLAGLLSSYMTRGILHQVFLYFHELHQHNFLFISDDINHILDAYPTQFVDSAFKNISLH